MRLTAHIGRTTRGRRGLIIEGRDQEGVNLKCEADFFDELPYPARKAEVGEVEARRGASPYMQLDFAEAIPPEVATKTTGAGEMAFTRQAWEATMKGGRTLGVRKALVVAVTNSVFQSMAEEAGFKPEGSYSAANHYSIGGFTDKTVLTKEIG